MSVITVMNDNKGVGILYKWDGQFVTNYDSYKFNESGVLVHVGTKQNEKEAIRLITDNPPLYDSAGNVVLEGRYVSASLIATGFRIIHVDGKAVGYAQRLANINAKWEVYKYTIKGPLYLARAENPKDIIDIIKNEEKLYTGNGEEV